jgi:hypothetical protein
MSSDLAIRIDGARRIRAARYFLLKEAVSRHTTLRGSWQADGQVTLLTVHWRTPRFLDLLIRSFRLWVSDAAPIVIVDNSGDADAPATTVVRGWGNIGHGLGLDLGMRQVRTEYTLVCDPDTAVLSPSLWPALRARVDEFGIGGVDTGNSYVHPLCVAFRTEWWKLGGFSFLHRWPFYDVGGELTKLAGGIRPEMVLPQSESIGPGLDPMLGGTRQHHLVDVYADSFANTYLPARLVAEPERDEFDGWPRALAVQVHTAWLEHVPEYLDGRIELAQLMARLRDASGRLPT